MRCIRTAAAFLPGLPARLIRTALSEAAAWEAPRTSSPCLWRKSRSARIMFARSVASEARLRTRVRSSSVRARAYRLLSSVACLSAAAMEASSTGPYLPRKPSARASWYTPLTGDDNCVARVTSRARSPELDAGADRGARLDPPRAGDPEYRASRARQSSPGSPSPASARTGPPSRTPTLTRIALSWNLQTLK